MITDDEIANLSFDIDDIIWHLSQQYKIDPFMLSSVMLARLAVMNMELGAGEDWNRLLGECIIKVREETEENTIH